PLDDDVDEVDEAPPPKKKGGAGKVLLILGAVGGVLLLFCCGGVGIGAYFVFWGVNSVVSSAKAQISDDWKKLDEEMKKAKDNPDFKFDPGDFPGMAPNKKPGDSGNKPGDPGKKGDTKKRVDAGNPPNFDPFPGNPPKDGIASVDD